MDVDDSRSIQWVWIKLSARDAQKRWGETHGGLVWRNPTPQNLSRRRLGEGGSLRRGQLYGLA
jgi:hypothetical protein